MKRFLAALGVAFLSLILIVYLFRLDWIITIIAVAITAGVLFTVIAAVIAAIVAVAFFCLSSYEEYLKRRANRQATEYETEAKKYLSLKDGFGMMHLVNVATDVIENLSAYPGTHHNGRWEEPHPAAASAWFALINKRSGESPVKELLPGPQQSQLDLLTIFTQPTQSYALIAGQQVGKTYQAQQIAAYWLRQGIKPLVIGPKRDDGEWPNCVFLGEKNNFEKVWQGLCIAKKLADNRHQDDDKSHKQHPIQPIFIDDWTTIRYKFGTEAENFIIDATTLYASVNIILYFMIHTDTANAWGVGRVGSALKDNFVKLIIEPGYNEAGLIDRRYNRGYLMRPGEAKRDRQPIKLFDSVVIVPQQTAVIASNADPDARFVELVRSGATRQEASQQVYHRDYAGNSFVRRCKELLGE